MLTSVNPYAQQASAADIAALEKVLGAPLPPSYRAFLLKTNGGEPVEQSIDFDAPSLRRKGDTIAYLYEVSDDPTYGLVPNMRDFGDLIPKGFVFIAISPAGNYFVMSLRPQSYGHIYYKDHEFEDTKSFDETTGAVPESMVKVADSFEAFQQRLYNIDG